SNAFTTFLAVFFMNIIAELIKYRGLILALVGRQLASRYRGSLLGFLWSFLNPLFFMLIYTLVFKYYVRIGGDTNYSVYLFCGLLPWTWFNSGLIEATSSISTSGSLITKSMFPPQILPAVAIVTNLVHYLLSLILLFLFIFYYQIPLTIKIIALPGVLLLQLFLMYGLALLFSSLNVFFRDVQHLLGNVLSLLFFLCPIIYQASIVPERFRFTIDFNPIALLIESYHCVLIDGKWPPVWNVYVVFLFSILIYILGKNVYLRNRETFAECL
ncbi:MAG: ABC transporter permease, partial [Candidatus Paceibacterota bacterium]